MAALCSGRYEPDIHEGVNPCGLASADECSQVTEFQKRFLYPQSSTKAYSTGVSVCQGADKEVNFLGAIQPGTAKIVNEAFEMGQERGTENIAAVSDNMKTAGCREVSKRVGSDYLKKLYLEPNANLLLDDISFTHVNELSDMMAMNAHGIGKLGDVAMLLGVNKSTARGFRDLQDLLDHLKITSPEIKVIDLAEALSHKAINRNNMVKYLLENCAILADN